ncbi:MAG: peptide chain release factor N(5)-glutamine methyltransferase [Candidatus Wildermuthbacteria bacterium]|nr:peptide chain release factor N(5)-glutamine methyltransferase [Candidatus Wildermuthbacteria bacterium]
MTREAQKDIERLKAGEPLDYVIGSVQFLGCKIDLSKGPFIPRPETEYWVERVVEEIKYQISNTKYKIQVLDLFAGSGCVGIAILKHVPHAVLDFVEKSKKFGEQIKINAEINRIDSKRYRILQSNVFSNIAGKYDYIFANPPYIAESRKNRVQKSVLQWEPKSALFGGKDGLRYIRVLLQRAQDHLAPGGKLYMEFDSFQKNAIAKLLHKFGWEHFAFFRDQYGKWRYAVAEDHKS